MISKDFFGKGQINVGYIVDKQLILLLLLSFFLD